MVVRVRKAIARWQDEPSFDVYSGEVRRDVSAYPWWNHWPTARATAPLRLVLTRR